MEQYILYIQHTIEEKLRKTIKIKYKNLGIKLTKLEQQQTITPREKQSFYPRIINNTNIMFTYTEISLLEKGLKFNFHTKKIFFLLLMY